MVQVARGTFLRRNLQQRHLRLIAHHSSHSDKCSTFPRLLRARVSALPAPVLVGQTINDGSTLTKPRRSGCDVADELTREAKSTPFLGGSAFASEKSRTDFLQTLKQSALMLSFDGLQRLGRTGSMGDEASSCLPPLNEIWGFGHLATVGAISEGLPAL